MVKSGIINLELSTAIVMMALSIVNTAAKQSFFQVTAIVELWMKVP
jgi:hypothetical protein